MVRRALKLAAISVVCLSLVLGAQLSWAADSVATIVGSVQGKIEGDSLLKEAPGAILVAGVGFGLSVPVPPLGGGGTVGSPTPKPFTLVKMPDKASPKLLRAAFTGETLKVDIQWFMTDPLLGGGARRKTFTVSLEGVRIAEMDTAGTVLQDGGVSEQLSLSYSKITFRDERSVPAVVVCIDLALNKTC